MNDILNIKNLIYTIRGQKVMLDSDLAMLYEVETKRLNEAVKRNIKRFPIHYMFQLTSEEYEALKVRSQIATSPKGGGRQYLPFVFTEQGVAMLSSVLRSEKAIQINIQIIDTFVQMRRWALENKEMAQRLAELEHYFIEHCKDNKNDMKRIVRGLFHDKERERKRPSVILDSEVKCGLRVSKTLLTKSAFVIRGNRIVNGQNKACKGWFYF